MNPTKTTLIITAGLLAVTAILATTSLMSPTQQAHAGACSNHYNVDNGQQVISCSSSTDFNNFNDHLHEHGFN